MRKSVLIALLVLLLVTPVAAAAELENGSFTAELNGFKIHYEVHGKGPVLMTLPNSWGLTLQGLRGLYRPIEDSYTMVYFDPRGMGESAPIRQDSDMGMAAVREDFDALRRHLKIDKANVIGWSNGAINLILLASEKPDTLDAAIFLHGACASTEDDDRQMAKDHPEAYGQYVKFFGGMANRKTPPKDVDLRLKKFYVEQAFPSLCADPAATRPKIADIYMDASFSYKHDLYSNKELSTYDFRDRLPRITARCLVIAGAKDLVPLPRGKGIADGIPGALLKVFKKSGHYSPVEEPEAFREALSAFFRDGANPKNRIVELEKWALDRWGNGDPDGFLSISDPDVTYFDPTLAKRMDGLAALKAYYEPVRGKVRTESWEMIDPKVEMSPDFAVLSFNLVTHAEGRESRWNCTEVYRMKDSTWRIVQTHWSRTQAFKAP